MAGYSGRSCDSKSTIGDEKEVPALAGTSNQEQSEVLEYSKKISDTKVKENAEDTSDSERTEDAEETEDVDTEDEEYKACLALFTEIIDNYLGMKKELNDWEQAKLLCDMEIARLPEMMGENLVRLVIMIGEQLGIEILEHEIVFAVRVGIRWHGVARNTRPDRRVTVRLANPTLRDAFLRAANKRRNLTTTDLGLPGAPQRVYFSERLTNMNRRLYRMARAQCRAKGWSYLWIRHGRIFVRKHKRSCIYAIRSDDNIHRAFQFE